jgi:hypothetical protein
MTVATYNPGTVAEHLGCGVVYRPPYDQAGSLLEAVVAALEKITAPATNRNWLWSTPYGVGGSAPRLEIDFGGVEADMRRLAAQQGLDFDRIVEQAATHFRRGVADSPSTLLTDEDIRKLAEDDDRAIPR